MPYQVIEPLTILDELIPLGVGLQSLTPIYLTTDQAFENLKTLLLTRKGERYNQPTFGTDLLNILFEPNTDLVKQAINDIINEPVARWLPYIDITDINVVTTEEDPSLNYNILITISFSVAQFSTQTITIAADNSGILEVA